METQIVKGNINELKGQIKQMWGKLTDDEIGTLEGGADELVGKLQKVYGYTKERAEQEFNKFKDSNSQYFRDNRGTNNQEKNMASTQFGGMDTNKIKSRAQHLIEDDIVEPAQQYMARAREFGAKAVDRSTEMVRENPGYSILGAAAVGFLAGAFLFRRRD